MEGLGAGSGLPHRNRSHTGMPDMKGRCDRPWPSGNDHFTKGTTVQIQVHTGKQIDGGENFNEHVMTEIEDSLKRFADRITRVEVHFADENSSSKSGDDDKRCVLEVRLTGMQPISVTAHASAVRYALDSALEKMKSTLSRTLDKLSHAKGRTPMGDLPPSEI